MHTQHEECRINTKEPICFNRFINYIIQCYYPEWNVKFRQTDFIKLNFEKSRNEISYYNESQIIIN